MKKWKFEVKGSPKETVQKLDKDALSNSGFVISINTIKKECIQFRLRKRIKDFDKLFYYNLIVLNGDISNSSSENSSTVEIRFKEHLINIILRLVVLVLGLLSITSGFYTNSGFIILGFIFFVIGVVLWVWLNYKFKINIQKYKLLINDLLKTNDK